MEIINKKKKMLIVLKHYYPECNSATALIDNIIEPLSRYYEITVACVKTDFKSPVTEIRNGVVIKRKLTLWDYPAIIRKKLIDRIYAGGIDSRLLRFALSMMVRIITCPFRLLSRAFGTFYLESYSWRFGRLIEDDIRAADIVLTTVMPSENAMTLCPVLSKYPKVKWVIIQSDPYVDYSEIASVISSKEEEQNRWYERATLVVVQETIIDNILRSSSPYRNKILPLFIPSMPDIITDEQFAEYSEKTVLNRLNSTNLNSGKRISCVFTGLFYSGVREPFFLLDVFARLHDLVPEIEVYILGTVYDHKIPGFNKINKDWLFFCGIQPQEVCDQAQHEADFLINVGNMVPNLVPSKVMQYISTRKPVINLYHLKEDVVEEYLADYPLKLSLYYDDYKSSDAAALSYVEELKSFIDSNYRENVEYDLVVDRYGRYSAENYVKTIMGHSTMN